MNKQIRRFGIGVMVLYGLLFAQLNAIQLFDADRYNEDPANTRAIVRDFGRPRGTISTLDGVVVAQSVELPIGSTFDRLRSYPEGDLYAHTVGYASFNFGATGVEDAFNDELSGQTDEQAFDAITDLFSDDPITSDVVLTLRHDVQQIAQEALGERNGSVVVIDVQTGAIRALWSYPSFDPNVLGGVDLEAADAERQRLLVDPNDPLLAKAYREIFFPGSTFKVVTAAAGLTEGVVNAVEPDYPVVSEYVPILTNRPLQNFGGSTCGGTLFEILRVSCNTAFAQMGAEDLGPEALIDTAERFGFNREPDLDIGPVAASNFPTDYGEPIAPLSAYDETVPTTTTASSTTGQPTTTAPTTTLADASDGEVFVYENNPALAQSAIGQNDVKATPLQMAMVAAAVANGGTIMSPHVVAELRNDSGTTTDTTDPGVFSQAMSGGTAALLRDAMINVVENGTASRLAVPGFVVGGKTGTAQLGTEPAQSHAWIIGFGGPVDADPTVAVAVIVEAQEGASEQTGGRVAAPIAQAVLEAALRPAAVPVDSTVEPG